jgi:hypothetical protein
LDRLAPAGQMPGNKNPAQMAGLGFGSVPGLIHPAVL